MPIEFALRGINAGLGLVGLLLLLNAGGLLREYALILPVGLAVSFLVDAGRTELVLKHGLREAKAAAIPRILWMAACASVACIFGAAHLRLGRLGVVALAVGLGGVAQVYVDIALRHSLYRRRSVLFVSWFQFACAAANVFFAYAGRRGILSPEYALAALTITPAIATLALKRHLLDDAVPDGEVLLGGSAYRTPANPRSAAMGFRIAPTAGYTVYLFALRALAPSLEATARALYFVFGFLHIRAMARHDQRANWKQRAGIMALVAVVISVPLVVFDRRTHGMPHFSEVWWGGALLVIFSIAGTKYLSMYAKFLTNR